MAASGQRLKEWHPKEINRWLTLMGEGFVEVRICDEADLERRVDYLDLNPGKHKLAKE